MDAGDRPDTPPAVSKTLPTGRASVLEAPPVAPQPFSTVPGHNSEEQGKSKCCGPFYWISAFLGWVVWVFSVSAVGDGAWIEDTTRDYGVDSRVFEEICSNSVANILLATACIAYEYFSVCQRFSTFSCSVAVLLYTISFFRPAEAPHGSAQALGLVGGIFMTIAAFFQMLACLFADGTITEVNELIQLEDNDDDDVLTRGPTYGVGIIALLLGVINAIAVFVSYRHGGDGPIFSRIKARNAPTALRTAPFVENITSDPSVAVLLYTISFFRPAEAPHGSAQALGLVGGIFMTIAAFFQMLACLFADGTITEVNELIQLEDNDDDDVLTRGPMYGVGIIALLLGVINAIAVFVSYRHGGDGPIFSRIKARNAPTALRTAPFVENITSDPRSAYGSTAASVA